MVIVQYSHTEDVDEDYLDDDALTKPLSRVKFEHFWDKLGVVRKDLPRKGEYWCCSGIVSSLGTFPKVIRRLQSSRMKRDCIILRHLSKSDLLTSVIKNEEGLYHPGTNVHNRSSDFSPRECGRITSSFNFGSQRYLEASVPKNVVGLHHPWTSVQKGI